MLGFAVSLLIPELSVEMQPRSGTSWFYGRRQRQEAKVHHAISFKVYATFALIHCTHLPTHPTQRTRTGKDLLPEGDNSHRAMGGALKGGRDYITILVFYYYYCTSDTA